MPNRKASVLAAEAVTQTALREATVSVPGPTTNSRWASAPCCNVLLAMPLANCVAASIPAFHRGSAALFLSFSLMCCLTCSSRLHLAVASASVQAAPKSAVGRQHRILSSAAPSSPGREVGGSVSWGLKRSGPIGSERDVEESRTKSRLFKLQYAHPLTPVVRTSPRR